MTKHEARSFTAGEDKQTDEEEEGGGRGRWRRELQPAVVVYTMRLAAFYSQTYFYRILFTR